MTDTPSSILLTREQSTGSNTNLWGGYLITTQRTTERATKGYQAYAVTGDATISWSNYSATNDYAVAFVKATGTPTASWTHTLPSYQTFFGNWNSTSYTGTLKNAAGTGIGVPANRKALLYSDAVDIGEATPNWISGYVSTLLNDGDIVVKKTMETAIASASGLTAPFILIDASDTTKGYFANKLAAETANHSYAVSNPGGNETFVSTVVPGAFIDGGRKTSPFTAAINTQYAVCSGMTFYLPSAPTNGAKCRLALFVPTANYSIDPNGQKIGNSTSAFVISGGGSFELTYDSTLGDWE